MNIKQSIALIFLLLGVSFSASLYANDKFFTVTGKKDPTIGSCLSVGSTYSYSAITSVSCDYYGSFRAYNCYATGSRVYCKTTYNYSNAHMYNGVTVNECPSGTSLNPLTGQCDQPCGEDEIRDPETGECKEVPFCDRDSTNEALFSAEQNCAASGGIFSFECHNGDQIGLPQGLTTRCTQPDSCVIGMPNWPECLDDFDPSGGDGGGDISPPSGDFTGGNLGTSNPTPPSSGNNPPPEIPPSSGSDAATVDALGTLQTSLNNAIVGTNTDMNQGFSDVNNLLSQINNTNNNIGQTITNQMNQDYQIHLKEKQLMLQQTAAIQHSAASINAGLDEQTLLLGEKLDAIKPCDPNTDIRSCEGQNGMTSDLVANVTEQVDSAVTSRFQSAEKEIIDSAQGIIDDSKLGPVQGHIDEAINIAMSAFPNVGNCTSFSIPTPLWGDVQFGCEFSVRFKSVASFIIYIYTIWSLIDILLNGVTPAAGTVPHRSRGI